LKKENGLAWEQDGIIYMEGQIYISNNRNLKEWILQENHDSVDIGYPGQQRMLELVKRNYWWLGIKEDINKYVQGCIKYQQNKVQYQQKSGKLHPLEILQVLQLRNLSVSLGEEPCIGFTQENLMENSLQDLSLLIYLCSWSVL